MSPNRTARNPTEPPATQPSRAPASGCCLLNYALPAKFSSAFSSRPRDALHADAVVIRVASRVAFDDHVIAGLQRFTGHAIAAQLAAGAPFHRPSLHLTFVIRSL